MRQWRASFTASKPSGFTIGFMAPAPRPAEISSNISRAFTIPIACIRPWAISAQPSLSVWRPNPVHFFGGRSEGLAGHQGFRDRMLGEAERVELQTQELWPAEMCDQLPAGKRVRIVPVAFRRGVVINIVGASRAQKKSNITVA